MRIHCNELRKLFHLPLCFCVLSRSDILIIPTKKRDCLVYQLYNVTEENKSAFTTIVGGWNRPTRTQNTNFSD